MSGFLHDSSVFLVTTPLIDIQHLSKHYGHQRILDDISLSIYPGEFLTLLGPSGCGKTTLLRMIAGFDHPTSGDIYLDGRCVNKLSPQQRDVHTVFQQYALFPHLNVFENVAFALRCKKMAESTIRERVLETLAQVQLDNFATRSIKELSGGQQQRVAIARAIVNQPAVLLLDEPLSSLDYRLKKAMQSELKALQKSLNITFVFVTHDQEEALSMSDRIVVFNYGRIEQIGSPRAIYETPANLHVAQFIGEANIFDVTVANTQAEKLTIELEKVMLTCPNHKQYETGTQLHLVVRPEDIRVFGLSEVDDTKDMIAGRIVDVTYKGSTVDVCVALPSGRTINASEFFDEDDDKLEYTFDESVWVHWPTGWEVLLPYEA